MIERTSNMKGMSAMKTLSDLFLDLRVVDAETIETDQGPVARISFESPTNADLLSCVVTLPAEVADEYLPSPPEGPKDAA
jgi:hypothetical protein